MDTNSVCKENLRTNCTSDSFCCFCPSGGRGRLWWRLDGLHNSRWTSRPASSQSDPTSCRRGGQRPRQRPRLRVPVRWGENRPSTTCSHHGQPARSVQVCVRLYFKYPKLHFIKQPLRTLSNLRWWLRPSCSSFTVKPVCPTKPCPLTPLSSNWTRSQLLQCLRETRAEKKTRRKVLREFEDEFYRQTGRWETNQRQGVQTSTSAGLYS